jgi:hypothetical protein
VPTGIVAKVTIRHHRRHLEFNILFQVSAYGSNSIIILTTILSTLLEYFVGGNIKDKGNIAVGNLQKDSPLSTSSSSQGTFCLLPLDPELPALPKELRLALDSEFPPSLTEGSAFRVAVMEFLEVN